MAFHAEHVFIVGVHSSGVLDALVDYVDNAALAGGCYGSGLMK